MTFAPSTPKRGGAMMIAVRVDDDRGIVSGATVKILLTFPDNRQILTSGITDAGGTFIYTFKIPLGTITGLGKIDIMAKTEDRLIIQSGSFTVK
jgi:hypothetical protein